MTTTPQAALLSDDEIVGHLETAGVKFQRFKGGISGVKDCWSTSGSQDVRKLANGIRSILAKLQATQAEPPKDVSMPQYWSVDVFSDGAKIVSIGNDWLSGERQLDEIDERTIIGAAQHLLSFVGYGLPPTSFDPDAQAEPVQAGELPPLHVFSTSRVIQEAVEQYATDYARAALSARKPLTDEQIDALRIKSANAMQALADRGLIPAPEVCDEDLVRRVERAHGIGLEVKPSTTAGEHP